MPSMTKLWLSTLKDPSCISTPEFRQLITELLDFCSSYTNPTKDETAAPMHAFFHDTQDPSKLVMITGYPSQEMNTEADKLYAERYLPRMFEFVQHRALYQVDLDVRTLPLRGQVVVSVGKKPEAWKDESSVGGWDYWPETRGIEVQGPDKLWVQVQRWDGSSVQSLPSVDGEVMYLENIGSS